MSVMLFVFDDVAIGYHIYTSRLPAQQRILTSSTTSASSTTPSSSMSSIQQNYYLRAGFTCPATGTACFRSTPTRHAAHLPTRQLITMVFKKHES
eukprot:6487207-Amphidinium_carterae.1